MLLNCEEKHRYEFSVLKTSKTRYMSIKGASEVLNRVTTLVDLPSATKPFSEPGVCIWFLVNSHKIFVQ